MDIWAGQGINPGVDPGIGPGMDPEISTGAKGRSAMLGEDDLSSTTITPGLESKSLEAPCTVVLLVLTPLLYLDLHKAAKVKKKNEVDY